MRCNDVARRQRGLDGATLGRADLVLEIDRQFGRASPFSAEPLQIRGHDEKPPENEQRQRDRRRRQQTGLTAAPEAGDGFFDRVAQRTHQASSTARP